MSDQNIPSNIQMRRAPDYAPAGGEMIKPTLPEGILPLRLAKVYPESMAAAQQAGESAAAAAPPNPTERANVDEPYPVAGAPPPPPPGPPALMPARPGAQQMQGAPYAGGVPAYARAQRGPIPPR